MYESAVVEPVSFSTVEMMIESKPVYECGVCFKQLSSQASARRHIQLMHQPKREPPKITYQFACQVCDKPFPTVSNLNRHMVTHTGDKPFACEHCEKRFTQQGHYKRHLVSVHGTGSSKVFCCTHPGCEKKFAYHNDVKYHMAQSHGNKNFACPHCGKLFNSEYNVRRHQVVHAEGYVSRFKKTDAKFQCEKCVWCFKTETALKKHQNSHEKFGDPTYNCEACNLPFFTVMGFDKHLHAMHDGQTPSGSADTPPSSSTHQCKVCGEKFQYRHQLKRHERRHTVEDESPVVCRKCGRSFRTKKLLMRHMMSDHTMGYLCRICGDRFQKQPTFQQHMKHVHAEAEEGDV